MEKRTLLKRCLQFSLGGLLLAALWFAGSAAGYKRGFLNGYSDGQSRRESDEPYYARYTLADVLPKSYDLAKPDASALKSVVTDLQQKTPDFWLSAGGYGESFLVPNRSEVVIYAEEEVHQTFARMLTEMPKNRDAYLMPNDGRNAIFKDHKEIDISGALSPGTNRPRSGGYGGGGYGGGGYGGGRQSK